MLHMHMLLYMHMGTYCTGRSMLHMHMSWM